jgi:hypothetical protein
MSPSPWRNPHVFRKELLESRDDLIVRMIAF